jgi:hypothetical protein
MVMFVELHGSLYRRGDRGEKGDVGGGEDGAGEVRRLGSALEVEFQPQTIVNGLG